MNRIVQKKILKVEFIYWKVHKKILKEQFIKKIVDILLYQNILQVRHNVEDLNIEE